MINTWDYDYAKRAYESQWDYPYILNVAEVPESAPNYDLAHQTVLGKKIEEQRPDTSAVVEEVVPVPVSVGPNMKNIAIIALIIIGAILLFK